MAGSVGQYTMGWFTFVGHKSVVGTWVRRNLTDKLGMGDIRNDSQAQNDEISWDIWLDSVTWKIAYVHHKDTNVGISHFLFDGVSVGTIDGYAAATAINTYTEVTGIAVATPSVKAFTMRIATKNASSSAYNSVSQSIALIRTGGTASTPAGTDTPGYTVEIIQWMGYKSATGATTRTQNLGWLSGGRVDGTDVTGAEMFHDIHLDSGTFKGAVILQTGTDEGILKFSLDGTDIFSVDGYAAAAAPNTYVEVTGLAIATAGVKAHRTYTNSKNASSTAHFWRINSTKWVRTGA